MRFVPIYIREAHPTDKWWLGGGVFGRLSKVAFPKASYDTRDPVTIEERRAVAARCEETLDYGIVTYVDELDDAVMERYAAWPTRLYLIDAQGVVAYAGGLGPYGFRPAELGRAIRELLG